MSELSAGEKPGSYAELRVHYNQAPLTEKDLATSPLVQFEKWFKEAVAEKLPEPNAMVVATVDAHGQPSARHVLLKAADSRGFVFYTNYSSNKGQDLALNPRVGLTFPWFGMYRQVNVRGVAERVSRNEAEEYFHSRPHGSQVGAWISLQSQVIEHPAELAERVNHFQELYPEGTSVPMPENWGGFLVRAFLVEFWAGRESRLHDRFRYVSISGEPVGLDQADAWKVQRLYP